MRFYRSGDSLIQALLLVILTTKNIRSGAGQEETLDWAALAQLLGEAWGRIIRLVLDPK